MREERGEKEAEGRDGGRGQGLETHSCMQRWILKGHIVAQSTVCASFTGSETPVNSIMRPKISVQSAHPALSPLPLKTCHDELTVKNKVTRCM